MLLLSVLLLPFVRWTDQVDLVPVRVPVLVLILVHFPVLILRFPVLVLVLVLVRVPVLVLCVPVCVMVLVPVLVSLSLSL